MTSDLPSFDQTTPPPPPPRGGAWSPPIPPPPTSISLLAVRSFGWAFGELSSIHRSVFAYERTGAFGEPSTAKRLPSGLMLRPPKPIVVTFVSIVGWPPLGA